MPFFVPQADFRIANFVVTFNLFRKYQSRFLMFPTKKTAYRCIGTYMPSLCNVNVTMLVISAPGSGARVLVST
jgi:hypothetical protein